MSLPATAERPTGSFVLASALLVVTLWMATRPYVGVVHDSRFYTVQALAALLPGRFADDLYFRFGSQDQFTLFTRLYEPALARFGIASAALALTVIGAAAWLGGLACFAQALLRDLRITLFAIIMALALPNLLIFKYGEQFLTPRLFAEAITLWALGMMLRGRPFLALGLLGVSATIHPLMTLPGLAILFLHEAAGRRVWWLLGGLGAAVAIGLAASGVQPFARLTRIFDPAWFDVVRDRDFFCFVGSWPLAAWLKTGSMFSLALIALSVADSRERRLLLAMAAVAVGGLVVTVLGADIMHDVLLVDIQQYRATWPLAVAANLFVAPVLLRARGGATSSATSAALVTGIALLAVGTFAPIVYLPALPALIVGGLANAWERRRRRTAPEPVRIIAAVVTGLSVGAGVTLTVFYLCLVQGDPALAKRLMQGLAIGAGTILVASAMALAPDRMRLLVDRIALASATGLALLAVAQWDQRTPWTRFVESPDAPPSSLTSLLPPNKTIYWEGDVRVPWFLLRRPDYFSCAQGTGALFFRDTAIAFARRSRSLEKLHTVDFGSVPECPASPTAPPPKPPKPQPDRSDLAAVCRENPELDLLVLLHPIDGAVGNVWVPPVPFEEPGLITGDLAGVRAERFYVYACDALRRS